ncbi:GNAT family N-acetyltransferase [Bermanella sp. R86510]|uniref:GNAT family N-acetyltransferase n=1 Tax=Bermanella sp. R86510 TaxID=3093852 RepID=UPI0037C7D696
MSDGLHTKGHYFYLFSNEVNEPVADVWLGSKDNGTVWGWDFYVYPEYQGQGYGYQVLSATLELLISLGFEELRFTVFKSNTNAIGLYKKFGFKVLAEHDEQLEMSIKVS